MIHLLRTIKASDSQAARGFTDKKGGRQAGARFGRAKLDLKLCQQAPTTLRVSPSHGRTATVSTNPNQSGGKGKYVR